MEILLLGTASADGWPSAYCDCAVCESARRNGGPDLRMRTGALIDDDLKIDHSPDTVVHMQRAGRSLAKVRSIIMTHEHPDHLFAIELKRTMNVAKDTPSRPPIAIFGNRRVLALIEAAFDSPLDYRLDLRPALEPFHPVTIDAATSILPLPATHCPDALIFRITRGGKSILYGHDSGTYKPETLDALGNAGPLDLALFDCTHTTRTDVASKHHMSIPVILHMIEEFTQRGAITPQTRLIATHFSPHSGALSHAHLMDLLRPHNITPAHDGLLLRV